MKVFPFYIITSDPTRQILPVTCYLLNKYWNPPEGQKFKILGQSAPQFVLPENFEFISIKQNNDVNSWTRYIADYIAKNEPSDKFIFTLDDFLPNDHLKPEILEVGLKDVEKLGKVGRVSFARLDIEKWEVSGKLDGFSTVRFKSDSAYRLSCQTSLWDKEYFLKYFSRDWSPWDLELKGSQLAKSDGWEVAGFDGKWPFSWVEESALSGRWPGMVNILGMRPEDVRYCIEHGFLLPEKLQYGIWYDCKISFISRFQSISKRLTRVPKFSEVGFAFKWQLIKPYVRSKTFKRLLFRYKDLYN